MWRGSSAPQDINGQRRKALTRCVEVSARGSRGGSSEPHRGSGAVLEAYHEPQRGTPAAILSPRARVSGPVFVDGLTRGRSDRSAPYQQALRSLEVARTFGTAFSRGQLGRQGKQPVPSGSGGDVQVVGRVAQGAYLRRPVLPGGSSEPTGSVVSERARPRGA